MNHIISNPKGIDYHIQRMQISLANKLGWDNIDIFGRVYKNEVEDEVLPQAFIDGEYKKDTFYDDTKNATIFFVASDEQNTQNGMQFEVEVKVIFMLNLSKLFDSIDHRADTEAQAKAYGIIKSVKAFKMSQILSGYKNVLRDFGLNGVKAIDLQPRHVFSVISKVNYKLTDC